MEKKSRRDRKNERIRERYLQLKEKERLLLEYLEYLEREKSALPPIVKGSELD